MSSWEVMSPASRLRTRIEFLLSFRASPSTEFTAVHSKTTKIYWDASNTWIRVSKIQNGHKSVLIYQNHENIRVKHVKHVRNTTMPDITSPNQARNLGTTLQKYEFPGITKLSGRQDFENWKFCVERNLLPHDLKDLIDLSLPRPPETGTKYQV